jgi:hypothetical protein
VARSAADAASSCSDRSQDYWHVHGVSILSFLYIRATALVADAIFADSTLQDTEKENASYAEAEAIRRKMLHEPEQDANAAIRKCAWNFFSSFLRLRRRHANVFLSRFRFRRMTSRLVEDMVSQEELEVAYCDQCVLLPYSLTLLLLHFAADGLDVFPSI